MSFEILEDYELHIGCFLPAIRVFADRASNNYFLIGVDDHVILNGEVAIEHWITSSRSPK